MKIISRNLILFATLVFIFTLLFRYGLDSFLLTESYRWVIAISVTYGCLMALSGWLTGRREGKSNFLFDAGFRWNFTTFLVWGLVSEVWALLDPIGLEQGMRTVHITLLIWSFFLVLHLLLFLVLRRKGTIKGVHKRDIFE